jgi:hypothetical protein
MIVCTGLMLGKLDLGATRMTDRMVDGRADGGAFLLDNHSGMKKWAKMSASDL